MPFYPPSKLLITSFVIWGANVLVEWFSPGYLYLMLQTVTGVLSYRCVGLFVSRFLFLGRFLRLVFLKQVEVYISQSMTFIAGPLHINTRYHRNAPSGI